MPICLGGGIGCGRNTSTDERDFYSGKQCQNAKLPDMYNSTEEMVSGGLQIDFRLVPSLCYNLNAIINSFINDAVWPFIHAHQQRKSSSKHFSLPICDIYAKPTSLLEICFAGRLCYTSFRRHPNLPLHGSSCNNIHL